MKDGDRVEKSFNLKRELVSKDVERVQYLLESQEAVESASSSATCSASSTAVSSVTARNWRELERLDFERLDFERFELLSIFGEVADQLVTFILRHLLLDMFYPLGYAFRAVARLWIFRAST